MRTQFHSGWPSPASIGVSFSDPKNVPQKLQRRMYPSQCVNRCHTWRFEMVRNRSPRFHAEGMINIRVGVFLRENPGKAKHREGGFIVQGVRHKQE
jgi:hypothetical protein